MPQTSKSQPIHLEETPTQEPPVLANGSQPLAAPGLPRPARTVRLEAGELDELRVLLDGSLGDLSQEIAATDNAGYRKRLLARREALRRVRAQLGA